MSTPWYVQFFADDYLRYYAADLSDERTAREADFIAGKLALSSGVSILDLCCGHEMVRLFTQAGLSVCDVWGETSGEPYSLSSSRMIILGEKLRI